MGLSKIIDAVYSVSRAVACHFASGDSLLEPGWCQADTPHLLHHALERDRKDELVCHEDEAGCAATQFFGPWKDQFVSMKPAEFVLPDHVGIESVMLCPKPFFFNSGPHRATMVVVFEGERFALAFEEGWPPLSENLFVGAFTSAGARLILHKSFAEHLANRAIETAAGVALRPQNHIFVMETVSDASIILEQGCTPSPKMHSY